MALRTIAGNFERMHIDRVTEAVTRCLIANEDLLAWTKGKIYRSTGAVKKSMVENTPSIYTFPSLLTPRQMPNTRERNTLTISIAIFWEEFREMLEDISEPTIASVVQVIKTCIYEAKYFATFDLPDNQRLIERVNQIRVVDIDGEQLDGSNSVTMVCMVEVEMTIDLKNSTQEFFT